MSQKKIELNKNNIKILICCHKPCELPPDPDGFFLPIQVGAAISDVDLKMQRDDHANGQPCDNISIKNKSFCELTAMYWAWKNIKKLYPNLKYIGINHYRRYFSFDKKNYFDERVFLLESNIGKYKFSKKNLEKNLLKNEIILVKPHIYPYTLEIDYCLNFVSEDLRTLKKIIHELYPEYDKDVYDVMTCGNKFSLYNIFLINWKGFDMYCKWLFDILFEAERRINITNYNDMQKRIFGYMAERLLNIWVKHNLKKIKKKNIIFYCNENERVKFGFIYFLRFIKVVLLGSISKPLKKFSERRYCQINKI